jgi:HAD superfamily hydrolase (TIGR01662 family)
MIKYVFFDRDGTLGYLKDNRYPWTFMPYGDIKKAFDEMKKLGVKVMILTNQSSIARGSARDYDFGKEFISYGADDYFICPHDDKDKCDCRKPKSGLLIQAQKKYGFKFSECLVVGDRQSDIDCGLNVGTKTVLVRTGNGKECEDNKNADFYKNRANAIVDDFTKIKDILINFIL